MNSNYTAALSPLSVRKIIGGFSICSPTWREDNCSYNFFKIYYYTQGDSMLKLQDDVFYPQPGELYLIPANTKHSYSHNPEDPACQYWYHLELKTGNGLQLVYNKDTVVCQPPSELILPLFLRLEDLRLEQSPADVLLEQSLLLEILSIFFRTIDLHKLLPPSKTDFVAVMNHYIESHLTEQITLKDLAELVHLHPNYFIPYFQRHFSLSPIEYINSLRLEKALQLLNGTTSSIQDIAEAAGYNDYRYFSRQFKKRYGFTPSFYRQL